MAISIDMRVLARKLEKSSDELLANAAAKGPDVLEKVSTAIVAASTLLEQVADDMDENASFSITPDQLNEIAALASAFDESKDPLLKKQASVLDELLLSIASPKNAVAMTRKATEDEVNRLREERRKARREEAYEAPRKAHAEMNNAEAVAKAVEQQVKRYVPLEAPLQTRYPPDRPGGQMTRITDHVYQDIDTGIIYDYKAGYTTQKGNKIPGGSVENQTRQLGDYRNQGSSLFETRESLMGRYAAGGDLHHLKKYAMHNEIAKALQMVRDNSHKLGLGPKILEKAIDLAGQDGLSTSEIGEILGDVAAADSPSFLQYMDEFDKETALNYFPTERAEAPTGGEFDPPTETEFQAACALLKSIKSAGWDWNSLAEDVFSQIWASHDGPDAVLSGTKSPYIQKVYDACMTGLTPEQVQETRGRETIPIGGSSGDTFIPQRDTITAQPVTEIMGAKKESLIALALSAVQELAPHLLSTAVDKALEGGLSKAQINYVLGSKPKFKAASLDENSEINIAKSLFAHLKALGWDDLIDSHLEVMGTLGVSKEAIQKLAGEFTDSKASLKHLNFLLKAGGVAEFAPEFFGTEDDAPPPGLMDDKPSPKANKPMFGTESSPPPPGLMGDVPVVEDWGLPEPPSGPITPKEDLVEWTKVFDEAKRTVFSKAVLAKINELQIEGETEKAKELVGKAAQAVNERMNAAGFVGAYENDASGKRYLDIAKILKGAPAQVPETVTTVGTGEGAINTSAVKWGDYQKQHGVFISKEVAEKLENRIKLAWDEAKESYDSVFSKFKFDGKELPSSIRRLPKEIFENFMDMKKVGESTEAMKVVLSESLTKYFIPRSSDLVQKLEQQLREKAEAKMAEAEAAEADGKSAKAKSLLEHAARIEAEINDKDKLASRAVQDEVNKWMPTEMDLKQAHTAVFDSDSLKLAVDLHRKINSGLFRQSVNNILQSEGLPVSFPDIEKIPPVDELTETLKGLGKKILPPGSVKPKDLKPGELFTKKKPLRTKLIHEYDKDLVPIWENPKAYLAALADVKSKNPLKTKKIKDDPETKAKWDEAMRTHPLVKDLVEKKLMPPGKTGFVPPSKTLFGGYANTHFMLYDGGKKNEKRNPLANPLADFTKKDSENPQKTLTGPDGKPIILKTIFSHPKEYVEKYLEGKEKFKIQWKEKPKAFNQIYGPQPVLDGVSPEVVKKILQLKHGGVGEKDAISFASKYGVPGFMVTSLYDYARESGEKIRDTIIAMTLGGKSLDEIMLTLGTRFAGAYIPTETVDGKNVVEAVYNGIRADQRRQAISNSKFGKWMEDQGFYSPFNVVIGEKTTIDLLARSRYEIEHQDRVGGPSLTEYLAD